MAAEYGKRFLELIKEHPDWKTKQYAEALSMEWDDKTQAKLWAFRKSHAKEIADLLGEPISGESQEACDKAVAELKGMTDDERQEYKNQCKGYEARKTSDEKRELMNENSRLAGHVSELQCEINGHIDEIARLKDELNRTENALTEANNTIAKLEAEKQADKAMLALFESANADYKEENEELRKHQALSEADELKIYIAEMSMAGWRQQNGRY